MPIRSRGPFDLRLSLAGAASFLPIVRPPEMLTTAFDVGGVSTVLTVRQPPGPAIVRASAVPSIDRSLLRQTAKWLIFSDLDLTPFYRLVAGHPIMDPSLHP